MASREEQRQLCDATGPEQPEQESDSSRPETRLFAIHETTLRMMFEETSRLRLDVRCLQRTAQGIDNALGCLEEVLRGYGISGGYV